MELLVSYFDVFNNRCPRNCSESGTCFEGQCQCNTGYLLRDCSLESKIFIESTEQTGIRIKPGQYGFTIIPVAEIFKETVLNIKDFEAPIKAYISSISNSIGNGNRRILSKRVAQEEEEENFDPPHKDKHEFSLLPEDPNLVNLGDGEKQIFLVDIFGESNLQEVVDNKSYVIVGFHNPSSEI
jgi:hypothetical protein